MVDVVVGGLGKGLLEVGYGVKFVGCYVIVVRYFVWFF